jgi:hypothetical protein
MEKRPRMIASLKKGDEMEVQLLKGKLAPFALRFLISLAVLIPIFYLLFPYYRILLRTVVGALSGILLPFSSYTPNFQLDYMPFVSMASLIVATPNRGWKRKSLLLSKVLILFFLIDCVFSLLHISLSKSSVELLLIQELIIIALPIAIWLPLGQMYFADK